MCKLVQLGPHKEARFKHLDFLGMCSRGPINVLAYPWSRYACASLVQSEYPGVKELREQNPKKGTILFLFLFPRYMKQTPKNGLVEYGVRLCLCKFGLVQTFRSWTGGGGGAGSENVYFYCFVNFPLGNLIMVQHDKLNAVEWSQRMLQAVFFAFGVILK